VNERGCESKLFVVLSRVKTGKARHKIKNPQNAGAIELHETDPVPPRIDTGTIPLP
jgi:hypothetical protein